MPKQPVQTHDETSAGGDSASEDGTTRLGVAVGDSRSPKKGDAVRDAGRDVEIVLRGSDRLCPFGDHPDVRIAHIGTVTPAGVAFSSGTSVNMTRRSAPTTRCSSPARPERERRTENLPRADPPIVGKRE